MRLLKFHIIFTIIIFISSLFADGDIDFTDLDGDYSGQTVFNFLTIPVSASQLSRSLIALPSSMDATDVPFAASGTAFFRQYKFAITHLEWLMGLRKEYIGACFPLLDQGTLGFYSQVFTLGIFDYARDIDEYVSDVSAVEAAIGASYARQLLYNKLSLGVTASYIESRLAGDDGRAFNSAFDLMYKPLFWLSAHGYARNIGNKVKYNDTPESQPFQTGLSLLFLPLATKDTSSGFDIAVALGAQKTIDAPLQIGIGADVQLIKQLSIRTGYEYNYGHDFTVGGLSAGIGFNVKQYGVDAGWKYQSEDFGSVWAVTVRYNTEEMVPKTAMDYYKVALRNYNRRRYNASIFYAKKALSLNPNMWRAHSLISKAISEIHQKKGAEVLLIYTGNTMGQFIPEEVNNTTMGGLARQAAVIKKLRKDYPLSFTVDAGNMITKITSMTKALFADKYYKLVGYDAVGLGIGEAEFGFKRYCKEAKKSSMDFICSNCSKKVGGDFVESKVINIGKYRIAVLSVLPATLSMRAAKDTTLLSRTMDIVRHTQSVKIKMCNLRILIANDSWETIQHYTKNAPLVDVVICGSVSQHFETPMKINNTPIVSTGAFGRYMGALELRFDRNRKLISFNNRLVPLTGEITPDPVIELLARQITLKSNLEEQGLTKQKLQKGKTAGVFTFVSDRRGGPHIYLKVMESKIEFPLTFGISRCQKPGISFKNGNIIYLAENDTLDRTALMKMDITGELPEEVNLGGSVSEACFTPDEKWIYASVALKNNKQTDIYRILPSGGESHPVINWKDGSERDLSFSTDGINMLFTSNRDGSWQVYMSGIAGSKPVRITDDPAHHYQPCFSPLDKYVAYLSEKNNFKGKKDIWVLDRNTGEQIRVTRNAGVRDFIWFDDKGTILYSSGANLVDFNTINIFTGESNKFIVTEHPKDYSETKPEIIVYKNKKRLLYTREYESGEKKLFLVDFDGTGDQQVSIDRGNCWLE